MTNTADARLTEFAHRPITIVLAVVAALLTALSARYGYHRDELYFLAAGDRLDVGYVDQPPLTPLLAKASVTVFGDTPMGLRVVATIGFLAAIVLVALIARELGAGRIGQTVAALGASIAGFGLAIGHMVSTSTFDMVAWLALTWVLLRLMRGGDPRWWLAAGAVAGVAILNKYLVVLLVVAILIGWLSVGPRSRLATGWLAGGVAVAAIIAAPNLWWQFSNDWPQLTVASGIASDDGGANRMMFLPDQILLLSPVLVPIWLAGWWRLWRSESIAWARPIAVAYPVLCLIVLATGGKGYYALPLLLVLTAAGAVPTERWWRASAGNRRSLGVALALGGIGAAVISLPVLPATALDIPNSINREQGEQVGWPELTAAVASAWETLTPDQRDGAVILTENYGQAGAVEHYGPDLGLPAPYSGHMSYADWGPPPDDRIGPVLVVHQAGGAGLTGSFANCRAVATVDNGHGVDNEEQGTVISVCDGPDVAWSALWPRLRHFY
ncbi:4-amino-4-deoxy-L-arabinose transferase-like glycosyltransferase [Stackebrandtia endophytica]|uniref:4-amino-4-deoxy-L-arabinose transferase-like glycosyltransferase n=1 Tax=Stackebrandtia endophytica TaxID=1496996 RepID=A0A543B207_9ACTN|nr:glycosyltransferase family 39 protein [Stackebrandtia endophytica]TQL78867.1 4-amino-4-deoxy-L-arabinose transferase-like glycosyltransferase [Stackebrandtia endophytica]